ncbi:hypothetical protein QO179_25165 [Bacillus stercoris]|nr:hypothetical protein [Bacillus stercoris]
MLNKFNTNPDGSVSYRVTARTKKEWEMKKKDIEESGNIIISEGTADMKKGSPFAYWARVQLSKERKLDYGKKE